jgi:hypothetical protein
MTVGWNVITLSLQQFRIHTQSVSSGALPNTEYVLVFLTNSVAQEPEGSSPHSQQPAIGPCFEAVRSVSYGGGLLVPRPNPKLEEAVSSIRNPRTRHAMVTVDPLSLGIHIFNI